MGNTHLCRFEMAGHPESALYVRCRRGAQGEFEFHEGAVEVKVLGMPACCVCCSLNLPLTVVKCYVRVRAKAL